MSRIRIAAGGAAGAAFAVVAVAFAGSTARPPIGDGKVSSSQRQGYVNSCQSSFGGGGAFRDGPWIIGDGTWGPGAKISVRGAVSWPSKLTVPGGQITGNGLPSHRTGTFPVAASDPAYQYDRNPNSIRAQRLAYRLPVSPKVAAKPTCLPVGAIGVMLTGSVFFNALDALGRDATAHEIQDACHGHPEMSGTYHYHSLSPCASDSRSGHSKLVGYAFDGFGIYGRTSQAAANDSPNAGPAATTASRAASSPRPPARRPSTASRRLTASRRRKRAWRRCGRRSPGR